VSPELSIECSHFSTYVILEALNQKTHLFIRDVFFDILIPDMDWSTKRKFGCFSIIGIIVLALLGLFVYNNFINIPETCSDGILNQNERCVDGGGVCARVCPMDAKTIVPLWYRAFPVTGDVWSVLAYVENQNITAGVQKIDYEFRVYDSDNILAGEPITGSTFIGPNERTAIFESPVNTGNRTPTTVFFKFTSAPDWTTTDPRYQNPQLTARNVLWNDIKTAPKLSADLVNTTLFDYKNVEVIVILYDGDGNAVNTSKTFVDEIVQQSNQKIYFTWPKPFDREVRRIEIISRINPFIQS